ncbi:unnamed protein product [Rotaria magnacalcarata]|uniref:Uncharacterized protein n=2 Tax=Rotaria magnacalcarata TaxID=392030 RepID=A0A8S2ZIX5_9BILA|nr:unnamed protein product [Rotaria magnacalcarata]
MTLTEAEFRFDSLQQSQSGFGFCSEDTTGVIPKVDISTEDDPTNFPKPFLLSAYGVDNTFTAIDILHRWMYIFESCLDKGVRIAGFSIDPVHIVTKWRNRLLSSTADLYIGNDKISMEHIEQLINNNHYTKLDHGLTKSDIQAKDRQNYNSYIKLISDDVINLLNNSIGIKSAWCVVFFCRLWWSSLEKTSTLKSSKTSQTSNERKNKINKYFVTRPAYISVEMNAHNLLYLVLLVKQGHLPKQTLINLHLFNSQPCESLFRDARSLSSTFSTVVNFTVKDFIRRSQKLSILNQFRYNQLEKDLSFPIHHKHKREHLLPSSHQLDEIDTLDVQQLISIAYDQALHLVKHSKLLDTLNEHKINCLNGLKNNTSEEFGLDEENDDNDVVNYAPDRLIDEIPFDPQNDNVSDDESILNSTKSDFNGIRIVDNINPTLRQSYFKVKINNNIKYLHKQSACWLQSNHIAKLSSDRLSRVMQQTSDHNQ